MRSLVYSQTGKIVRQDPGENNFEFIEGSVLNNDEEIVWRGRPDPNGDTLKHTGELFGFYGFFVLVIAFAGGLQEPSGKSMLLVMGAVLLGLIGWSIARYVWTYRRALRTYYAITNRRVIIFEDCSSRKVTIIHADDIWDYRRTDKEQGYGNLRLRSRVDRSVLGGFVSVRFIDGLWGIPDLDGAAKAVEVMRGREHCGGGVAVIGSPI